MFTKTLTDIRIEVLKIGKNMTWLIEKSGVSRDTFYKKIRQNDKKFIESIFIEIKKFKKITDKNK